MQFKISGVRQNKVVEVCFERKHEKLLTWKLNYTVVLSRKKSISAEKELRHREIITYIEKELKVAVNTLKLSLHYKRWSNEIIFLTKIVIKTLP